MQITNVKDQLVQHRVETDGWTTNCSILPINTHTHNHLTVFVQDYLGGPVSEETVAYSHPSWSPDILYQLPPSTTIHCILLVQFTCLTVLFHNSLQVLFGLPLGLEPSTSYTIHCFTQSFSSFCNTCPHHCNLFCCSSEIMSSIPNFSLSAHNTQTHSRYSCNSLRRGFWKPTKMKRAVKANFSALGKKMTPSVLWCCWLGGRKGIRPVKNWVVGYWSGYLTGARCRLAYGPADATATHCLLL